MVAAGDWSERLLDQIRFTSILKLKKWVIFVIARETTPLMLFIHKPCSHRRYWARTRLHITEASFRQKSL